MIFENVELTNPNISYGPDSGRIYSLDHDSDSLIVKTFPGGTFVQSAPLNANLQNEVISLEYDGYYFWSLTRLGQQGDLGALIEKWFYNGTTVIKQLGVGNEIPLINGGTRIYDSEAMIPQVYTTQLSFSVTSGSTSVTLDDTSFLLAGDPIYFGPSNAQAGEREEKTVQSVAGNTVNLTSPLENNYLVNDLVKYLKDIWLFNNANNLDTENGSLLQISRNSGSVVGVRSGAEWKGVTASTGKSNGDFLFIRNLQALTYRPFGVNAGFQSSSIILNEKPNRKDIVKVYDLAADSTSFLKLQEELVYFDDISGNYLQTDWTTYNVDQEFFANAVFSITHTRDNKSLLFKENTTGIFTLKVRDQYDIPVAGRAVTVSEDDPVGFIVPGYENIVTDVRGEAESRYRTGAGLITGLPEITIEDDLTSINSKTNFVQIADVSGDGFLEQREAFTAFVPISQLPASGQAFIVQTEAFISDIPLLQATDVEIEACLVQRDQTGITYAQQINEVISEKPIVQEEKINEIVQVQQYDFLIFAIPEPFSLKNPVDTNITVRIVGFGALSLIPSTLVFIVNGVDVSDQIDITSFAGGLELFYNPPVDFDYFSIVTVEIYILDDDVPQNLISTTYYFETVADFKDPIVIEQFPPNFSTGNSPNTEVYVTVKDNETGIDVSSIEFFVNGIRTSPTITENNGIYKVSFQTSIPYAFESTVSAAIQVSDNSGNIIIEPWNFTIGESAGIFFVNPNPEECDVLVPVETNICVEAFGKEQGIHIESTVFTVDGKEVVFALLPKVFRKD